MTEKIDPRTETISQGQTSEPNTMNTIADYINALIGIMLYIASIAIVAMFVCSFHQVDDVSVLRENLRNDLIVDDIKHIVQMVLRDIGMMECTPFEDVSNIRMPLPDNISLGEDGLSGEKSKNVGDAVDLNKLHKRRPRRSRSTRSIISNRKKKKRRNGRPLRLW